MFHTGRDCAACQPVLYPIVEIESSLGKRQAKEIRCALKSVWMRLWHLSQRRVGVLGIADKISGPKRSVKITDRFTCTSANVIYGITCTLCKKLYIGETGRRLGDRFRATRR